MKNSFIELSHLLVNSVSHCAVVSSKDCYLVRLETAQRLDRSFFEGRYATKTGKLVVGGGGTLCK